MRSSRPTRTIGAIIAQIIAFFPSKTESIRFSISVKRINLHADLFVIKREIRILKVGKFGQLYFWHLRHFKTTAKCKFDKYCIEDFYIEAALFCVSVFDRFEGKEQYFSFTHHVSSISTIMFPLRHPMTFHNNTSYNFIFSEPSHIKS